jgi:hypothetical protein
MTIPDQFPPRMFFVPALVAMAVAGASLWREKGRP